MPQTISINPDNLSNLLFYQTTFKQQNDNVDDDCTISLDCPYVSPKIQVSNNHNTYRNNKKEKSIIHGNGLIAKEDIAPGECLFVIPPTFHVHVQTAIQQYYDQQKTQNTQDNNHNNNLMESIAESLLLQSMKEAPSKIQTAILKILVGDDENENDNYNNNNSSYCPTMTDLLVGTDNREHSNNNHNDKDKDDVDIKDSTLLNIIRRNAFGPDFVTYPKIQTLLDMAARKDEEGSSSNQQQQHPNNNNNNNNNNNIMSSIISRILGLYPLAAMLNHSCHPNVVRVYKQSIMIAHACESIKAGQELVWSYIPPTTPYIERKRILQQHYQFTCQCIRCQVEQPIWEIHHAETLQECINNHNNNNNNGTATGTGTIDASQLEETILSSTNKDLTNEAKRYLRMGFAQSLYIPYLNNNSTNNNSNNQSMTDDELLLLCTQLHFTFCACNNASTEHLSILFFSYDLVARMHSTIPGGCIQKVRFWTEQLKKACMIRYGQLGNDLESVRTVMQHSKRVLRTVNGLQYATYKDFI